jgi:hypothetical protein
MFDIIKITTLSREGLALLIFLKYKKENKNEN